MLDHSGKPVPGAKIEPVALSINYAPVTSDEEGQAVIAWQLQEVEWINVSKDGYQPQKNIKMQPPKQVTVKLHQ